VEKSLILDARTWKQLQNSLMELLYGISFDAVTTQHPLDFVL